MSPISQDLTRWRFWRHFLMHSFASVGVIALVLEVINELFPKQLTFRGLPWGVLILCASAIYGLSRSWPRPIQQSYSSPNVTIRILEGDIFRESCHLVIGTCDTFDTLPPNIIARESLQAQALDRLFGGDVAELDGRIEQALAGQVPVGTVRKPGKQLRYEMGTTAVVTDSGRRLFLLAYTYMNEQ